MRKRLIFSSFIIILLTTFVNQDLIKKDSKLNIKKIYIENSKILTDFEIKNKLDFLYGKNILLLKSKTIEEALTDLEFIDSFQLKKKYPDEIKIKVFEKIPIAVLQNKRNKFYYTDKDDLVPYILIEKYKNLPVIFGNENNFKVFYSDLVNINFPIKIIKTFYLFESKRWDLVTQKNQIIKLPSKNYIDSLKNFISLKNSDNFDKYKLFDYRISGQLILK